MSVPRFLQGLVQCVPRLETHCTKAWDISWNTSSVESAGYVQDRVQDNHCNLLNIKASAR